MTYVLPKPRYTTAKLYTASQVQDAFDAGRAEGLEAAAAYLLTAGFRSTGIPAYERFADAIRNLASNAKLCGGTSATNALLGCDTRNGKRSVL